MSWRDLLQKGDEVLVLPWLGDRTLRCGPRTWTIQGRLPQEIGWYKFSISGSRKAHLQGPVDMQPEILTSTVCGYLVGDRLVPDGVRVDPDPATIGQVTEAVHLIEEGLDRFVRIKAGRTHEGGPLVYVGQEMPTGPEDDVLKAYLDELPTVEQVRGVPPALDAAFRMETLQRIEAERRRQELERQRREEEERRAREDRRRRLIEQLGDAAGRREMARVDFAEAARAALAVGGATLLDTRAGRGGERIVRFRLMNRRFECVVNAETLRVIDAGICLVAHGDDGEFEAGTRGDTLFTLESLPAVIMQAQREGRLVVFRHLD